MQPPASQNIQVQHFAPAGQAAGPCFCMKGFPLYVMLIWGPSAESSPGADEFSEQQSKSKQSNEGSNAGVRFRLGTAGDRRWHARVVERRSLLLPQLLCAPSQTLPMQTLTGRMASLLYYHYYIYCVDHRGSLCYSRYSSVASLRVPARPPRPRRSSCK